MARLGRFELSITCLECVQTINTTTFRGVKFHKPYIVFPSTITRINCLAFWLTNLSLIYLWKLDEPFGADASDVISIFKSIYMVYVKDNTVKNKFIAPSVWKSISDKIYTHNKY